MKKRQDKKEERKLIFSLWEMMVEAPDWEGNYLRKISRKKYRK